MHRREQCRLLPDRRTTSRKNSSDDMGTLRAEARGLGLTHEGEIAAAMVINKEAPAMTGQMIAHDGGEQLGWAQPGYPRNLE